MQKTTGLFNRYLFTQIGLDSGSLTALGVVMHCFDKPGLYRGQVRRGEDDAGAFLLSVDADSPQMQVDIDLAHLATPDDCCDGKRSAGYVVNPRGYAVFHVSDGPGGFHVLVAREDSARGEAAFDSRELHDGDMFAAHDLRPGAYAVANSASPSAPEGGSSRGLSAGQRTTQRRLAGADGGRHGAGFRAGAHQGRGGAGAGVPDQGNRPHSHRAGKGRRRAV